MKFYVSTLCAPRFTKKLLLLFCLCSGIFFETRSSDGSSSSNGNSSTNESSSSNGSSSSNEKIVGKANRIIREPEQESKLKKTALTLAAAQGRVDLIQSLLKNHADINEKDEEGQTALIAAASRSGFDATSKKRYQDTVTCLVKARANVNAVNSEGKNALMLSLNLDGEGLNEGVVRLLMAAKTDVTIKDFKGNTLLDYAGKKWLWCTSAIDLLEHIYISDNQHEQEQWAALIDNARRTGIQGIDDWLFNRMDR